MHLVRASVSPVCFVHWPVDPGVLETRLPQALSVATREGTGWVSILGQRTRPMAGPVPLPGEFAQLTIRTYVRAGGDDAVYFLRVDANSRFAAGAARSLFDVRFRSVDASVRVSENEVLVRTSAPGGRLLFDASFERTDTTERVGGDSLIGWLTDRSTFAFDDGRTGEVEHDPWTVAEVDAEVRTDDLLASESIAARTGDPLLCYSPGAEFGLRSWPSVPPERTDERDERTDDSAQ